MSIFLSFLYEVCGLWVWVCAWGVSHSLCSYTPLCCNIQTPCLCWMSGLVFQTLDDHTFPFSSQLSVSKGHVSWGMPMWAKNAKNLEDLLRLYQWVQEGVRTGIRCHWWRIPRSMMEEEVDCNSEAKVIYSSIHQQSINTGFLFENGT